MQLNSEMRGGKLFGANTKECLRLRLIRRRVTRFPSAQRLTAEPLGTAQRQANRKKYMPPFVAGMATHGVLKKDQSQEVTSAKRRCANSFRSTERAYHRQPVSTVMKTLVVRPGRMKGVASSKTSYTRKIPQISTKMESLLVFSGSWTLQAR